MSDVLLSVEHLAATYDQAIRAVSDVSFSVPAGEIVAVLGANGAGKSTTLQAVSALLPARRGQITGGHLTYDGRDVSSSSAAQLVRAGLVPVLEGRHCFASLSVEENLITGAIGRDARRGEISADLERIYALFPQLTRHRRSVAGLTSGGEQQMLAIGRALTLNPKVLLLDEPTEGLAPIIVEELLTAIGTISRAGGLCSIIVEQHAQKLLTLADRVVILERGTIVHDAPSSALKADPAPLERHLGVASAAAH